jgi:hypothetical protein
LWSQFLAKAEFGAKLAYDMAREREAAGTSAPSLSLDDGGRGNIAPVLERDSGTLTPLDKTPDWRGRQANKNGV